MSLSLSLSPILCQSHRLELSQKLELAQRLAQSVEALRSGSGSGDPASLLQLVIEELIRLSKPEGLRQVLRGVVCKEMLDAMMKTRGDFAPLRCEALAAFSLRHIYSISTDGAGTF